MALPLTLVDVLPEGVAGVLFAAPLAAIMSTVDSMVLVVCGVIVRDLYKPYVNPQMSDARGLALGSVVSGVVGVLVVVLAFRPPAYLEYLVIYAIGGLEVLLFVPIILGLYWRRGNALGAGLAMAGGGGWYVLVNEWAPDLALGMFPIATVSVVAFGLYVLGSLPRPAAAARGRGASSGAASARSTRCSPTRRQRPAGPSDSGPGLRVGGRQLVGVLDQRSHRGPHRRAVEAAGRTLQADHAYQCPDGVEDRGRQRVQVRLALTDRLGPATVAGPGDLGGKGPGGR